MGEMKQDDYERAKRDFDIGAYRESNPDIQFLTPQEYLTHFLRVGIHEHRLISYHPRYCNHEFGREIIIVIPYLYNLMQRGLFFQNQVVIITGMKPFYYFIPDSQIIEKPRQRVTKSVRGIYVNHDDSLPMFNEQFWTPPPYRDIYWVPDDFSFQKPLLIIQNKHNVEWEKQVSNYIPPHVLEQLFELLMHHYQIVYIHPQGSIKDRQMGFSIDDQQIIPIQNKYLLSRYKERGNVLTWDDICNQVSERGKTWNYNEIKLRLFSHCQNYIGVLGGNNYLNLYFAKKLLILRLKVGHSGLYQGWYRQVCPKQNVALHTASNLYEFIQKSKHMFIDSIPNVLEAPPDSSTPCLDLSQSPSSASPVQDS